MAVDLLTWVCEKLTENAPHAANGLADFVADRVLRRFVVLAELESMTEADPEDVRLYIREAYTLEGEALAAAQGKLTQLTAPAEALAASANVQTTERKQWAAVKALGGNRAVANLLAALDMRERVEAIAKKYSLTLLQPAGATTAPAAAMDGAAVAAALKSAKAGGGGTATASASGSEKAAMKQGRCIDSRLVSQIENGREFGGKKELEALAKEWAEKEVSGLSDTEVRSWLYDHAAVDGAVTHGFRTKMQKSGVECHQMSLMSVQEYTAAPEANPMTSFLRELHATHKKLIVADINALRHQGDGEKIYEAHIKGCHADDMNRPKSWSASHD